MEEQIVDILNTVQDKEIFEQIILRGKIWAIGIITACLFNLFFCWV